MPVFHWTLSLGDLAIASSIVTLVLQLGKVAKAIYRPAHVLLEEHALMWADFMERKGESSPQARERGLPPLPLVLYRQRHSSAAGTSTTAETEGEKSND
jgi:hypothetical protein